MPVQLPPPDFDEHAAAAVRGFWPLRAAQGRGSQGGSRDGVLGGKNLDAFVGLVRLVARHCGLPEAAVLTRKGSLILPGWSRATKSWDVLVLHRRRLVAVFEFKSQVGSFGNNLNNRAEEVIGAAVDLWVAHHHGAYSETLPEPLGGVLGPEPPAQRQPDIQRDPRPPFLGWMMLLEDCPGSGLPERSDKPNFPVFGELRGASYARRYQILCERLVGPQAPALPPRRRRRRPRPPPAAALESRVSSKRATSPRISAP